MDNIAADMKEKLCAIFSDLDISEKGHLDESTFCTFLRKIGCNIEATSARQVYALVTKSQGTSVSLDDIYSYLRQIAQRSMTDCDAHDQLTPEEIQLISSLLRSTQIPFKSFIEFVSAKQQKAALSQLRDHLEDEGEEGFVMLQFHEFQSQDDEDSTDGSDDDLRTAGFTKRAHSVDDILDAEVTLFKEEDTKELSKYLKDKLNELKQNKANCVSPTEPSIFNGFQRTGCDGKVAMCQTGDYHKTVLPGQHNLMALAFNVTDTETVTPEHVTAKVSWIKGKQEGQPGKLVFESDFEGKIPTVLANDRYLSYYGCCLANKQQKSISLAYKHQLEDFEYNDNYLANYVTKKDKGNGASLERHEFQHLDCPLSNNSGVLVIGKFMDEDEHELHLTGFRVPAYEIVHIPSNTIHINDYLRGIWRTMLSADHPIDSVKLVKEKGDSSSSSSDEEKVDGELFESFVFTFDRLD